MLKSCLQWFVHYKKYVRKTVKLKQAGELVTPPAPAGVLEKSFARCKFSCRDADRQVHVPPAAEPAVSAAYWDGPSKGLVSPLKGESQHSHGQHRRANEREGYATRAEMTIVTGANGESA